MTKRATGYTLIELLVALAILAVLLTIAVPRYFGRVEHGREVVLKENLHQMRDALDKFYTDQQRYPDALDELVSRKYLRRVPIDPVTDSDSTWVLIPPDSNARGKVYDVRSGAEGNGRDGSPYANW
jgi:general secretion pathway protein G